MFIHPAQVHDLLNRGFPGIHVLVAGDVILDRYLWGDVTRISPEAPVPVVRIVRESETGGGAANVALNLAGLGVRTGLSGYVGRDATGDTLRDLLAGGGVADLHLVERPNWPTITKTRVIGGHQQMLRLDWEQPAPPDAGTRQRMLDTMLAAMAGKPGAVILSDYGKGVLDEAFCQAVIPACRQAGIPVLADPKGMHYEKYRGATAISPNRSELATATRAGVHDLEGLLSAGAVLRRELQMDFLALTLSDQGIALIDDQGVRRLPAMAREVYDVSGAGDTVIATLAAGLAAGLQRLDALHLANVAAGVVVGKVGTTPINRPDLISALSNEQALENSEKIATLPRVLTKVAQWRALGERVVFTNGCFDLLHAGHVTYLEQSRKLGHRLVVGLNTDRSVRALKGPSRPIIGEADRARVLAAMAAVDAVVLFDEETPLELIRAIQPDVLAKGADYTEGQVVGGELVKSWGGRVALVTLVAGRSSSRIVAAIQEQSMALT